MRVDCYEPYTGYCARTTGSTEATILSPKDRYDVSDLNEAQSEPGSGGRVPRNLRSITSPDEMERIEAQELARTVDELVRHFDREHRFTADDIRQMHERWLGTIYDWAGQYRQANVSKDGFPFAAAAQIPRLMQKFDDNVLAVHTPLKAAVSIQEIVKAAAEVHVELVLIHPFRDGNGRIARLLLTLMALQAGLALLDFTDLTGANREAYFAAVRAGLDRNYGPMAAVLAPIIGKALTPPS
jgi:cell filamentation protein